MFFPKELMLIPFLRPTIFSSRHRSSRRGRRCEATADVQDIEYTVEEARLWLLQTRAAKRSAPAAVRLALQRRYEGLIDDAEALHRVTPEQDQTLLLPSLQPETRLAACLLASTRLANSRPSRALESGN
jgi:pyruvate, orthophosphate dikinase